MSHLNFLKCAGVWRSYNNRGKICRHPCRFLHHISKIMLCYEYFHCSCFFLGFTLQPVFNKHFLCVLKPNCKKKIPISTDAHPGRCPLACTPPRHSHAVCLKEDGERLHRREAALERTAVDGFFPRKQASFGSVMM